MRSTAWCGPREASTLLEGPRKWPGGLSPWRATPAVPDQFALSLPRPLDPDLTSSPWES